MTAKTDLRLRIMSWDENPLQEFDDGHKLARAEVGLAGPEDGLRAGRLDSLLSYRPDGTSSYVSLLHLSGTMAGRQGSFVLQGPGTFDGKVARGEFLVVDGSGTGGLAGLSGTATSVSSHDDYPFMPITLEYVLE